MDHKDGRHIKRVLDHYMARVPEVHVPCDRCLTTTRWGGRIVLMVVDAAFMSIGLNYFTAVVPKVALFRDRFVNTGRIIDCAALARAPLAPLRRLWKNRRSWDMARAAAGHLAQTGRASDRAALRAWARQAPLEGRHDDPIGRISGVGINTYQYLRMMGGVDTVMPDKIVKRVIFNIQREAGLTPGPADDLGFITMLETTSRACGYRPIDVCWMTWLVQSEGDKVRSEKYRDLLPNI
ncbi:MAG: hypothetical protein ABIF71_01795 [Planctomycetota bacterium]